MLQTAFMLLMSSAFLMLKLGTGTGSFPKPLSPEEERECVEKVMAGDLEARNKLIEHNLRLVAHIIKKYYTMTDDQDDIISIGTIGLIKGVSTYRPDKGVKLATYASKCIENEILMYFRSQKKSAGVLSLSDTLDADDDGGNLSLMDVVAQDEDLLESISAEETERELRQYISTALDARESTVIEMRYGLAGGGPKTQREVAAACGISRSYVSRIEKKALEKLRDCFEKDNVK